MLSNFSNLLSTLEISSAPLNGRYPRGPLLENLHLDDDTANDASIEGMEMNKYCKS